MRKTIAWVTALLAFGLAAHADEAGAALLERIVAHCPGKPHSWGKLATDLARLDRTSDRLTAYSIGGSVKGRQIALAAVYHPDTKYGTTARLFIIARQHGSETAGTEAAMCLIRYLAETEEPAELRLLQRVTLIIAPMVNPDGAGTRQRRNANDRDLNRDWSALSQPETRAVEAAVHMWRPHGFIDLHELPARSSKAAFRTNFVETMGPDRALPSGLGEDCMMAAQTISSNARAYGYPLNAYFDDSSDSLALAHRHFGFRHGLYSFLLESKTGGGRDMRNRVKFHLIGILTIANWLAGKVGAAPAAPQPRIAPPMMAAAPRPPTPPVAAPPPQRPPPPPTIRVVRPTPGAPVAGSVTVLAEASDSSAISYVTFTVDGAARSLTNVAPYAFSMDTTRYGNGPHTVVAQAHGRAGTKLCEAQTTFTIRNAADILAE